MNQIERSSDQLRGRGLALSGILLSCVMIFFGIGINAAMILPALPRAREAARRATCANNLKELGLVLKNYMEQSESHMLPDISNAPGMLMCEVQQILPKYVGDTSIFFCPSDVSNYPGSRPEPNTEEAVNDDSYVYLGYVITTDDQLDAFADVYKARIAQGLPFDEDLPAPPGLGSFGGDVFIHFRDGIESEFKDTPGVNPDIQSRIPVMWDKIVSGADAGDTDFGHFPGGTNVLFMDGHVEFIRFPGEFPVTSNAIEIVEELDAMGLQANSGRVRITP